MSLLTSVRTILVVIVLTSVSIVHFDYALPIANAQPTEFVTSQIDTLQREATFRQGTAISTPSPLPGQEEYQSVTILPPREDGSIYSGILTYTASEEVVVVILNMQNLNETEQQILNTTENEFGTLLTLQLDPQTSIAITIITPDYGDTPILSASIPFAANALLLQTLNGDPFVAQYAVTAQVQQAEVGNNIANVTEIITETLPEEEGAAE